MKNGSNGRLSERPQFNVRIPEEVKRGMVEEIQRQGRKRDVIAARVFQHFLSLKPDKREEICSAA